MTAASPRKSTQLALLAAGELLAMTLWFSASAVVPQLTAAWGLDTGGRAWLTMSVQLGFVAGALASAVLNLPDRVALPRLMAGCAFAAALANGVIAAVVPPFAAVVALRFATGVALAGVYPPGMKLVATWCKEDRGFGIGLLVGALTLGSGVPHLLNAFAPGGMPPWRGVLAVTSIFGVVAAVLVATRVRSGPLLAASAPFDWRFAGRAWADPATRLANLGYLGHMWELYAMWAWVPILLLASYERAGWPASAARLVGFGVLAAGAVGCVVAGRWADRLGRTRVATASLAVSGLACLLAGPLFAQPALLTALCLVWGFAVVADSAQFSAAVSELADPRYVGSALTLQTCVGFLLTLVTLRLVPLVVERSGWTAAFALLAIGPALGIVAMVRLRGRPEAVKMASGRR